MRSFILIISLAGLTVLSYSQTKPPSAQSRMNASETFQAAAFPDEKNRLRNLKLTLPAVDKIFQDFAKKNHLPSMAYGIVADGKLIYSGATGIIDLKNKDKATTKSLFRIASMTKSFTAMAIMKLQEEGKLSIIDPASKYVSEMKDFKYLTIDAAPISIYNLLTMTAGFPEDNPWGDRQLEDTAEEFRDFLKGGVSFSSSPGQQFEYSNLGYAILGNIVTRASGMPYQEYITKNILQPLGMNNTYWEFSKVDPETLVLGYRWEDGQWKEEPMLHDGAYGAMGGLITSIEDFSKYVAFHLSAYPLRNDREQGPVKRSAVREMHKPHMPHLFTDAKRANGTLCPIVSGYGFGLGYRQDCEGIVRVSHSGGLPGFGSEYRFYPDYGIGVISFANRTYAGTGGVNGRVLDTLVLAGGLKPRVLPASEILNKRKAQLIPLLSSWDEKQSNILFAENFFLDLTRTDWEKKSKEVFDKAGKITSTGALIAENQLCAYFMLNGEKGSVQVYFTLSPENDPKIQQLDLSFEPAK
ncbi:MAG: serine hydrolase [Cyclobacteriaceae bacterium]